MATFTDDFNRTQTGLPSPWTVVNGTPTDLRTDGDVYCTEAAQDIRAVVQTNLFDATVTATQGTRAQGGFYAQGVVLRHTDESNYYRLMWSSTTLALVRVTGGATSSVASATITVSSVRVEMSGQSISVFANGGTTAVFTYTDTVSTAATATRHGIQVGYSTTGPVTGSLGEFSTSQSVPVRIDSPTSAGVVGSTVSPLPGATTASCEGGAGEIVVNWTAVAGADGYRLYKDDVQIADYPAGTLTHTDGNLAYSTSHTYHVVTYNTSGDGPASNDTTCTSNADPVVFAVTADIYLPDGITPIAFVPRRKGVRWQDELNGVGVGQLSIHVDDQIFVDHPNLFAHGNIVKFTYEGEHRFAFRIEQRVTKVVDFAEKAGEWRTVSGRGLLSLLADAVVYPEYGLTSISSDERLFSFASKQGTWFSAADWDDPPVAILPADDTTFRGTNPPSGWPDNLSKWMAVNSPNDLAAVGKLEWFRAKFVAPTAGNLRIYIVADNWMTLFVNGEPILTHEDQLANSYLWKVTGSIQISVLAGDVLVAVRVQNGGSSPNPMGFMLAMYTQNSSGDDVSVVMRTDSLIREQSFVTYTGPGTPGWRASDIILTLLAEAQARNVQACDYLTADFTSSLGTDGVAFTDRQDLATRIGFETILDIVGKLTETVVDVAVSPQMEVQCWKSRGVDRTAPGPGQVTLARGVSLVDHEAKSIGPSATRLLVRTGDGRWQEVVHAAGEAAAGRREAGLSLGNADSPSTGLTIANAALDETALERQMIESGRSPARSTVKPYVHFGIGDVVLTLDETNTYVPVRVAALSVEESDDGVLFYTPELYV